MHQAKKRTDRTLIFLIVDPFPKCHPCYHKLNAINEPMQYDAHATGHLIDLDNKPRKDGSQGPSSLHWVQARDFPTNQKTIDASIFILSQNTLGPLSLFLCSFHHDSFSTFTSQKPGLSILQYQLLLIAQSLLFNNLVPTLWT